MASATAAAPYAIDRFWRLARGITLTAPFVFCLGSRVFLLVLVVLCVCLGGGRRRHAQNNTHRTAHRAHTSNPNAQTPQPPNAQPNTAHLDRLRVDADKEGVEQKVDHRAREEELKALPRGEEVDVLRVEHGDDDEVEPVVQDHRVPRARVQRLEHLGGRRWGRRRGCCCA